MAHSTNRSIDFAPAWLKLPEGNQDPKRQQQEAVHNLPHHQTAQHRHSISQSDHYTSHPSNYTNTYSPHDTVQYNQFTRNSSSNQHHHHHPRTGARPHHINNYRSGPSSSPQHPIQLQRSQSTPSGNYGESTAARPPVVPNSNTSTPVTKPLEEEFPLLCSGPSPGPASHNQSQRSNQVNNTAQWGIRDKARDEGSKAASSNLQNDSLLTSNMTGGKVYRAQVKPVKRSNVIAIGMSNGTGNGTSNAAVRPRENGEICDNSPLSSSLDKEKKFLQELGWNEEGESDDDCGIPEQDPAQLQQIMKEAKLARERLLMKHSMKPATSTVIPMKDDLPSSSDNSDNE